MSNKRAENVVIGKNHGPLELRFSANTTVRHFTMKYLSQLTMSALVAPRTRRIDEGIQAPDE